jgi:anti-sigma-K factor RskA
MDSHSHDDAAVYAINGLPPDEAYSLDKSLDPHLREEIDSFRRVAVALTDGLPDIVPAASPELWNRISEQAGITSPPPPPHTSSVRPSRFLLLAAAATLAAVVGVGYIVASVSDNNGTSPVVELAAAPGSLTATLTSPDGVTGIAPEVVVAADGTGYVVADSLPRLTDDRTYQLWLVVDDKVISAALLGNDPELIQFRAEGDIAAIAISNEVAGGVVVSEVAPTALWVRDA